jgi:hypothetical protein
MFLKRNLLWILFFGTLIGLNEALIGSFSFPYRSVVLSSITLALLSFARFKMPLKGTSVLIIFIAVLFKLNSAGLSCCTTSMLLCGPTVLLLLGISYEAFAGLCIGKNTHKYSAFMLTCGLTAMVAFSLFALMNTYILRSWNTGRLYEYIFIKASLCAIASIAMSVGGLQLVKKFQNDGFASLAPYVVKSILGFVIVGLWLFGTFAKL